MPVRRIGADAVALDADHYTGELAELWLGWVRVPGYIIFIPTDGGKPVSVKNGQPSKPPAGKLTV